MQLLVQPSPTPAKAQTAPEKPTTGLFRTQVTVRTLADRARLEKLGVVVLEERAVDQQKDADNTRAQFASFRESVAILADADQLEALARLRFEPQGTDEVGALVAAHAAAKPPRI
jgi:hypothetical protein